MLLWLRDAHPELEIIDTYNAESNHHMIAINDKLGCTISARGFALQRHLGATTADRRGLDKLDRQVPLDRRRARGRLAVSPTVGADDRLLAAARHCGRWPLASASSSWRPAARPTSEPNASNDGPTRDLRRALPARRPRRPRPLPRRAPAATWVSATSAATPTPRPRSRATTSHGIHVCSEDPAVGHRVRRRADQERRHPAVRRRVMP